MTDTKRPYDVTGTSDFLHMESDNTHFMGSEEFSLLHNGKFVSIHGPAIGGRGVWMEIPVEQFNRIVDWYVAPQPLKRKKAA